METWNNSTKGTKGQTSETLTFFYFSFLYPLAELELEGRMGGA